MPNHFTPDELSRDLGLSADDIIRFCVAEGIPIYKGKIDRSLLTVVMKAKGINASKPEVVSVS